MANLYVSSCQLQGAREREEVLTVMQEIVISLVGSEEFGIFERRDPRHASCPWPCSG